MKISVIIPVRNEEENLAQAISRIRLTAPRAETEIIVADGGSSDRTVEIARRLADKVIALAQPGRAGQMQAGARAASGDILLFLHADTRLPGDWREDITNAWSPTERPLSQCPAQRRHHPPLLSGRSAARPGQALPVNTIVIFVKAPVPGKVKTRLCPPLSHEQAATLYRAFVRDTLAAARKVARARLEISYQPAAAYPDLRWLGPDSAMPYFVQNGAGLGRKLVHAFEQAFRSGARKVVVLGSDTPHIEPAAVREAFRLLESRDAVLGPAADGGYYLVGLKKPVPALFAGVSWSTPRVLRQTLDRARRCGVSYGLLPECRDIDTFADLESLTRPPHGFRTVPPFTRRALGCSIPALAATHS